MVQKRIFFQNILLLALLASILALSCNKDNPTMPQSQSQGSSSMSMIAPTPSITLLSSTLTISRAKFLIEFVKLEKSRGSDDCDLKEGPFVVDIALSVPYSILPLGSIPPGTYTEVHTKIHKHTPNETVIDPEFGTTGEVGFSGIIEGTYNGIPFTYRTSVTAHQEIDIDPPLVITSLSDKANVSVVVDASLWFVKDGRILDPLDAANSHEIDKNIKDSFKKGFRDDDHDCHPDHEHGG